MIERVHWRLTAGERPPFERDGRRLRVTVHCPNPEGLSTEDRLALDIIRELAHLKSLRIADTDSAAPWQLSIEVEADQGGFGAIKLRSPNGAWADIAMHHRPWNTEAIHLLGVGSESDPRVQQLLPHLPIVEGHRQAQRDVLVTTVPELLALRSRAPDANIRTASEGLKVIGLYLRAIEDFTVRSYSNGADRFDRGLFYWVLCRERLPSMWRYFAACLRHASVAHDNTEYLGSSILNRSVRALQAKDEVGFRFFQRQNNSTRDGMLYHFDFLTLMLSGAFDAEARVARRAYQVTKPALRTTTFRNEGFRRALEAAGGTELAQVTGDSKFLAFQQFLGALRNTVHSAGLQSAAFERDGQPQTSIVRVLEDEAIVWSSSGELGKREDLGVTNVAGVAIEPYTCAAALTELGLFYIDAIARSTDIERLLPTGTTVDELLSAPPDDATFRPDFRQRIGAMG